MTALSTDHIAISRKHKSSSRVEKLSGLPRSNRAGTVPLDLPPIHRSKPQSRYSSLVRGIKQYTVIPHVGFFNTTGVSLTCIVQVKWLNSCGIASQLCHYASSMGSRQAASNLPAVYGSYLAAAAGAQVPHVRTRIATRRYTGLFIY